MDRPAASLSLDSELGAPLLPRVAVDTRMPATGGRVIVVPAGGDLQAALNAAAPGDVVELQPGAVYRGAFVLPAKLTSGWIVVRPAFGAPLPREGTRVTPADAAHMPKLIGGTGNRRVLAAAPGASHYRLIGIEIAADPSLTRLTQLVELGTSTQSAAQVPHHIVLDRVYVHGHQTLDLRRCVALNSAWSAVIDSHLSECHSRGSDSQAIGGWNGPGPFLIQNNYLEGAAENIMFGGADPSIKALIPSDIVIRRNHITKPLSWKGVWLVKNLLELKNAQRVLIEGNVLENSWVHGQDGIAVNLKSTNQSGGCSWCVTRDVTFRNNWVRNSAAGIKISRENGTQHILLENNLFTDIARDSAFAGHGRLLTVLGPVENLQVVRNTAVEVGTLASVEGDPQQGFVFRDNVVVRGQYGFKGAGTAEGAATLRRYMPDHRFSRNVLIGANQALYPSDNFFTGSTLAVGFADPARKNYRLVANSPFRSAGTGGSTPGIDQDVLSAALHGVVR